MKPKKTKHILNEDNTSYVDLMDDISNQDGIIEMPEHLE